METCSLDPYEQQLLSVFNTYDIDRTGSLDHEGLVKLCNTLQLEEQGSDLIKCLLSGTKIYVTFNEFKDGLLTLLQNQSKTETKSDSESESPERELSPKFVYGSKKYGRRSRPEEMASEDLDKFNKSNNKVQRSSSQTDVTNSKKRKTSSKVKRCTSFPGNQKSEKPFVKEEISPQKYYHSNFDNENLLREALERLGVGQNGYLNHYELLQVCESIGLHKITEILTQVSEENELDYNKKISVDELLEALQKRDESYNVPSPISTIDSTINTSCITEDSLLFPVNKSLQYISLGPDGTGVTSSQSIVEMWENAGIQSASNLLQELGFNEPQINLAELNSILEDELRTFNDRSNISFSNPQIILLQATICLYQSEIKYLKSILEQMNAEREKLRCDIAEANYRSSLLAQEIDENHAKMEKNTQKQVRLLEQRHAEVLKELTAQFTGDKEQMSILNSALEKKITSLENEESKLKLTIQNVENYNCNLEKENQTLSTKISELEQIKEVLNDRVTFLESECRKIQDLERDREQLEPLLHQINLLQQENSDLRDKNDELCTEVENLSTQISTMRLKISDNVGAKRRVDSPSKDIEYSLESESPRLGKVRKCYKPQGETLHDVLGPFKIGDSVENDFDYSDNSLSINEESFDEVKILKQKISQLENILTQNSIKIPENFLSLDTSLSETEKKDNLLKRCQQLEKFLDEIKLSFSKMLNENYDKEKITELSEKLEKIVFDKENISNNLTENNEKSEVSVSVETDLTYLDLEKQLDEKTKYNSELKEQCDNLQQALELLRSEFDSCENYWSSKLDEERLIYEQEQKQSSEKLNELLIKIAEYEEQFANDGLRLPPIEENECLEKQYVDLEEEYLQYREEMETHLQAKDEKIAELEKKLSDFNEKVTVNQEVQVTLHGDNKVSNLSNVIESSNIFSSETLPHLWNPPQIQLESIPNQIQSDSVDSSLIVNTAGERDYTNPAFVWNNVISDTSKENSVSNNDLTVPNETSSACNSLPASISWQQPPKESSPQPHSLSVLDNPSTSNTYRVKRNRRHSRHGLASNKEKNSDDRQFLPRWNNLGYQTQDQSCVVPIASLYNLHRRLHELDQHCRHLQFSLKQQQTHSEAVMHHLWKQYRDEITEMQVQIKTLQEKLSRSDILIKDLYVENTHLIANNQRLEHRCHMLIQCNSESTSV